MRLLLRLAIISSALAVAACGGAPNDTRSAPPTQGNPQPGAAAPAKYPSFPLPAPRPSAKLELSFASLGPGLDTVGSVEQALARELDRRGYDQRSYFAVPGGFALATQAERFERDGRSAAPDRRWVLGPTPLFRGQDFSLAGILKAFRTADPGRYRVILFVVTTNSQTAGSGKVSIGEAREWLNGADVLPQQIRQIPLGTDHHLSVLIYEFARASVSADPSFVDSSPLDARRHLVGAGLLGR